MKKLSQFALQAISLTSFLVLWQLVIVAGIIPNYLVPTPVQVVFALVKDFHLADYPHCDYRAASGALARIWSFAQDCSCGHFNVFPYYRGA